MVTVTINQIVNNMLLKRRYPRHYYLEFMLYAVECLGELIMDDLLVINSQILPVDSTTNTVQLPESYGDYILVGYRNGQSVVPLVESNSLDDIDNYNSSWQSVRIGNESADTSQTNPNQLIGAYGFLQWFTTHYNNFGENVGKFFGGVAYYDTFRVIKSRNVIKLNNAITVDNIVLVWTSNGVSADAASAIDPYATDTIRKYIMYQFKENNRTYSEAEAQVAKKDYTDARAILRARISDLTLDKLKRIVQKNSIASPKY